MKRIVTMSLAFGALAACGSVNEVRVQPAAAGASQEDQDDDDESEEIVALSEIPQIVKDAAVAAAPGLVIQEAERESDGAGIHYCVHGTVDGVFTEVEVTPTGKVLEVESGDDEDEDEGPDDD